MLRSATGSRLRAVSGPQQSTAPLQAGEEEDIAPAEPAASGPAEVLDALPVLRGGRSRAAVTTRAAGAAALPAVQAAAVAAGGFVAGAAVVGLVHRRGRRAQAIAAGGRGSRALTRRAGRPQPQPEFVALAHTRALLVDVQVLGVRPAQA